MDIKKNPKLQTSTSSNLFFTGGLVVALSLTVFAFEYKTYDEIEKGDTIIIPTSKDEIIPEDEIPVTTRAITIAPPPPEPEFKVAPVETTDTTTQREPDKDPKQQTPQGDTTTQRVVTKFVLSIKKQEVDEVPVDVAQVSAGFPGGNKEYTKFLSDNLKYPNAPLRNGVEGTVYVKFIVDKDGTIIKDCVKISKSIDPALDAEAMRVVKMSPKWTPAKQNERPIKQRMRVPVRFKIQR